MSQEADANSSKPCWTETLILIVGLFDAGASTLFALFMATIILAEDYDPAAIIVFLIAVGFLLASLVTMLIARRSKSQLISRLVLLFLIVLGAVAVSGILSMGNA